MKALRISLIFAGCSCIAFNIGQIAFGEPTPLPIESGLLKILGVYFSKLYLLFAGIILAAIGSNVHAKAKDKRLA